MTQRIFHDIHHFVTAWHEAQASLDPREQDVLHSFMYERQTLKQIGLRHRLTVERIRQLSSRALKHILARAHDDANGPIATALADAASIIDSSGIEAALQPRRVTAQTAPTVIQQLTNIGAISQDEAPWALVVVDALPRNPQHRPTLRRLVDDARQIAGKHQAGATPEHLFHHLTTWHDTMAAWPNFNLSLHIQAITANIPDPSTNVYHPIIGWNIPLSSDPKFATHYAIRALREAQQPLTIDELTPLVNQIAQRDGIEHQYSKEQITLAVQRKPEFKWAGPSTYGLSSWPVGHSDPGNQRGLRLAISDEVFHLLEQSPHPLPITELQEHIRKRFEVSHGALMTALYKEADRGTLVINPDRTVSPKPQAADSHSI